MEKLVSKPENNVEDKELIPITQKDFEKFIKGKGIRRNDYNMRDLKTMFGFKPMFSSQRIILSLGRGDPIVYDSVTKASEATGVPVSTIALAKERTKTIHPVTFKSKGNEYTLRIDGLEDNVRVIFEHKIENEDLTAKEPVTPGLRPISHKDFNEFIKGKGFVGRNNYKLKELKAMFGFKPMVNKNQVTVTVDDGKEMGTYDSMSRASLAVGIPYSTLLQAKKKSKNSNNPVPIKSNGNIYVIKFNTI